jgi:uncharacterized membrane protein
MAALLAFTSAMLFGVGDFMGGLAARQIRALVVASWSQLVGLAAILTLVVVVMPVAHPTGADLAWGVVAGLAGAVGVVLLYTALSTGPMSVAAPVTAVLSAVVPVVAGLALGERPHWLAGVGAVLAFPAIVLIASAEEDPKVAHRARATIRDLLPALGAGFGFGLFFVFLAQTSSKAGLWPLVGARTASVAMLFILALLTAGATGLAPGVRRIVVVCGLCDAGANALYLVAVNQGLLSLVAVLAALYPASTVVLARIVLKERMSRPQLLGLAVGAVAAALVAVAA